MQWRFSVRLAAMLVLAGCDAPGQPVAASAAHWELSAEYVANTMLKSDAAIAEALRYNQIHQMRRGDLPPGVYARYRMIAQKMGLHPLPALYLDALDTRALPQASARFSREGRSAVILNPSALREWSPRQLVAVMAHELVHLKERHVTSENLAAAFNRPELSVAHELEADRIGSGLLGSCDPEALKQALQITFAMDMQDLAQKNQIVSADDYDSLTGADHPNREKRLAALDAMAADMPQGCR